MGLALHPGLGDDSSSTLDDLFAGSVSINPTLMIAGIGFLFIAMLLGDEKRVRAKKELKKGYYKRKISAREKALKRAQDRLAEAEAAAGL